MKKFLPYIFILVFLVGVFSSATRINAAATGNCFILGPIIDNQAECEAKGGQWQAPGTPVPSIDGISSCTIGSGATWTKCIMDTIGNIAYNTVLKFAALILWIAGTILNFVLDFTIVNMSKNISGLTGINIAWKALRDLMNIAFVFLLVYEGIRMIIGQGDTGKLKHFITWIVLASLLINFSLFFTKVMIDASNIVTIGIYNSILDNGDETLNVAGNTGREAISGLSVPFMSALGMSDWYSNASFAALNDNTGSGDYNVLIFAIAGTVLFIIVAFVFFAVACIFTIRYITLLVLLMLSPVAYMGAALPFMKSYADEWWESFKSQLFFAPVYMLMTWVILTLMSSPNFIIKGNWGELITNQVVPGQGASGGQGSIGLLFNFVVIIGLVIFSLITAKSTASKGSKLIGQATGTLTKFAGDTLIGGGGWLGRKSLGLGGKLASDSVALQEKASKGNKNVFSRTLARTALYGSRTARDATFDIRNASVPGMPNATPIGAYMAGITGVGQGATKGYREEKEASDKKKRDKETANATELELAQAKRDVIAGSKDSATAIEIEKMEKALSKLSDKQTEALVAGNRGLLNSLNFANSISVKQLEALNKSDQFSDGEKNRLKGQRFAQIASITDAAGLAAIAKRTAGVTPLTTTELADAKRVDDARKRIKGLSDSELEMIDPNYLDPTRPEGREFISQLKAGQVETITANKGGKFTTTQKTKVGEERMRPLKDALGIGSIPGPGNVADIQREIRKVDFKALVRYMKVDGRGTPPIKIALDPAVLPLYTSQTLKRMAAHDDMSDQDIHDLRVALLTGGNAATIAWLNDPDKGEVDFPL